MSDELYKKALDVLLGEKRCSTSLIQRRLAIGYNKASTLVERMEKAGLVSAPDEMGKRTVAEMDLIKSAIANVGVDTDPGEALEDAAQKAARPARSPKMKEDADFKKHNQGSYRVAKDELRSFIERLERLDAEKADIADQAKEVNAEAKSRGYDTKVMRKLITMRKKDPAEVSEEEAVLELYREALGM